MSWTETALLLCDLQNDFIHPDGAYARAGLANPDIAALPARLRPLADRLRHAGGCTVATHFTLVPGRDGEPFISPHLKSVRPFLARGDFAPASWGQATLDELGPIDLAVEKIAFSAFYMTRLEWVLRQAGIHRLIIAGIVTNGGVASTTRDAHVRDFKLTVLTDGCAAFTPKLHQTAIQALAPVAHLATIAETLAVQGF